MNSIQKASFKNISFKIYYYLMTSEQRINFIVKWIKGYCNTIKNQPISLVVGVSGGIDSAVTSTICALTGMKTFVLSMPIKQIQSQDHLSKAHCTWLKEKFKNIEIQNINLDSVFEHFQTALSNYNSEHAYANSSCLLYTSPRPRDATLSRMPSSA
mgnify:CR=1 FL=1